MENFPVKKPNSLEFIGVIKTEQVGVDFSRYLWYNIEDRVVFVALERKV